MSLFSCPTFGHAYDLYQDDHTWPAFHNYRISLWRLSDDGEAIRAALNAFFPLMMVCEASESMGINLLPDDSVGGIPRNSCLAMCALIQDSKGFEQLSGVIGRRSRAERRRWTDDEFYGAVMWAQDWLARCYSNTLALEEESEVGH